MHRIGLKPRKMGLVGAVRLCVAGSQRHTKDINNGISGSVLVLGEENGLNEVVTLPESTGKYRWNIYIYI